MPAIQLTPIRKELLLFHIMTTLNPSFDPSNAVLFPAADGSDIVTALAAAYTKATGKAFDFPNLKGQALTNLAQAAHTRSAAYNSVASAAHSASAWPSGEDHPSMEEVLPLLGVKVL